MYTQQWGSTGGTETHGTHYWCGQYSDSC